MPRRDFFIRLDDKARVEVIAFMQETARKRNLWVRRRGNAVLLSHQGWTIKQISQQFKVTTQTVRNWLHRFREKGVAGLYDPRRQGQLTLEQEAKLFKVSQRGRLLSRMRLHKENRFGIPKRNQSRKLHSGNARRPIKGLPSYQWLVQWVKDQWGINLSAMRLNQIIRRKLREPH